MTQPPPRVPIAAAALLVIATLIVYTRGLEQSPPYLMHDELQFSLQARAISQSGHDLSGRLLPVFFTEPEFPAGRDPAIIYFTAALLKVLPFSQGNVKVPTALVGALNVALIFVAAWWLTGRPWLGLLAALFLALTPIHFIRSRLVLSPFYSIPFILGWLIALAAYLRSGSRRALLWSVACVALSLYSYLACTVMAPIYFVVTAIIAVRKEGRGVIAPMLITAGLVALPIMVWYATHPERYSQLIDAYRLYGMGTTSAIPAPVLSPGTPKSPKLWLGLLWQFLDPNLLFISGDSSLINSTRTAGLFPLTFAVFMLVGIWTAVRSRDMATRVMLIGLVTAPVASVLSGAIEMNRIMFVIPFGVLIATLGARTLLQRGTGARVIAALLIAGTVAQFASFHRAYFTDYPVRAASWFGGNVRDAVVELSKAEGPVFFSAGTPFISRYWAFYAPEQSGRSMTTFESLPPADAPPGSRAACRAGAGCEALARSAGWRQIGEAREPSGASSFLIFER